MARISVFTPELSVEFAGGYVRGSTDKVQYPHDFFVGMCPGMHGMGAMRPVSERFRRTIITLVLAHEGGFGNLIAATDELDILGRAIEGDGVNTRPHFMWQITLLMWYDRHGDRVSFCRSFLQPIFYGIRSLLYIPPVSHLL